MTIKFEIKKIRLGHVPVGGLFTYEDKLWKKVNRIDGENTSLVTNIGNGNRVSILLASAARVCYIIETLDIQEGTNGSD